MKNPQSYSHDIERCYGTVVKHLKDPAYEWGHLKSGEEEQVSVTAIPDAKKGEKLVLLLEGNMDLGEGV